MKILFLSPSGQLGGAELSLLDLLASLRTQEPEWELILLAAEDGPLLTRANEMGIETHLLPFPVSLAQLGDASPNGSGFARNAKLALSAFPALRYTRKLSGLIRTFSPDIVHTNGFKMHVLGAQACNTGMAIPVIWHVRDFVSDRPVMGHLLQHFAKHSVLALANSNAVAEDLRRVVNGSMTVRTVYNAIDLDRFSPNGPKLDLDHLSGLPPANSDVIRVGLVATLAFWKGHEVFLHAMSRLCGVASQTQLQENPETENPEMRKSLPNKNLSIRGYVIGGEIYQTCASQNSIDKLRSMAAELGISDRIGFTGHVADSASAMRALDIVVHASTRPEPFGRVIVEAMACGRAVIVSAQGGAAEIVTPGVNAVTHAAGDPQSLADAVNRLSSSPELRQKLGEAGLHHARSRFSRERLARELVPTYTELTRVRQMGGIA